MPAKKSVKKSGKKATRKKTGTSKKKAVKTVKKAVKEASKPGKDFQARRIHPLSPSMFVIGLLLIPFGFLFLANYSLPWGFIVGIIGLIITIASLINMAYA